eukprot:TRINITY_DN26699_c0_g1_i1.p1 TRINITY_DN26699_c0_g1~~TRINITY_DN26699_c0_g1_i1.p1  ORF type:complete len:490 (+),score=135.87 TRINITY_DN26699_c0_g1_i1:101-1471(+)
MSYAQLLALQLKLGGEAAAQAAASWGPPVPPGSIAIDPYSHKPNLQRHRDMSRAEQRERVFQERKKEQERARQREIEDEERRNREALEALRAKEEALKQAKGVAIPPPKADIPGVPRPGQASGSKGLKLMISIPTAERAQAAGAGARPKAAARQSGIVADERRQRQLEEKKKEEFEKMQAEAKKRLIEGIKPYDAVASSDRLKESDSAGQARTDRSRSREKGNRRATSDPYGGVLDQNVSQAAVADARDRRPPQKSSSSKGQDARKRDKDKHDDDEYTYDYSEDEKDRKPAARDPDPPRLDKEEEERRQAVLKQRELRKRAEEWRKKRRQERNAKEQAAFDEEEDEEDSESDEDHAKKKSKVRKAPKSKNPPKKQSKRDRSDSRAESGEEEEDAEDRAAAPGASAAEGKKPRFSGQVSDADLDRRIKEAEAAWNKGPLMTEEEVLAKIQGKKSKKR